MLRLLFIINAGSGSNSTDWALVITNYFVSLNHTIELYHLTKDYNQATIKEKIQLFLPQQVVAVGGDGTIKLVAECLLETDIALGILPAGSANGLAKELGISTEPIKALDVLLSGNSKKIHLTNINGEICIHLSDIGLNAYAMKRFKSQKVRGMWGYFVASLNVLLQNPRMEISMKIDEKDIKINAEMIVIANATKYGTGAVINPIGKLDDELFEVIVVKEISFWEVVKMFFSNLSYDLNKIEVFQTDTLSMRATKKVHFQVDGEYLGKIKTLNATLMPNALQIVVPNM
ncbi:diacylglycerol/lipid kinase family protein [Emticicia sp. SJ17W-69]|uniref:diacylglycerol/lipid kinase family protein n=1 Tax=Emticicia sp. SJ17W-69 TaxID=3421657 RepID=UPI003EBA4A9B